MAQVKTNVTNTANSLNIRKLMQQPRKGKAMADFMMADEGTQNLPLLCLDEREVVG